MTACIASYPIVFISNVVVFISNIVVFITFVSQK